MPSVYFEDLELGSVHVGKPCVCDKDEMLEYIRRNDPWPFHIDETAAPGSTFGGVIASGGYIITLMYRSLIEIYNTPRATCAFLGGLDWKLRFLAPVRPQDVLQVSMPIKDKRLSSKPGRGVVTLFQEMLNQRQEVVFNVEVVALLATRPAGSTR